MILTITVLSLVHNVPPERMLTCFASEPVHLDWTTIETMDVGGMGSFVPHMLPLCLPKAHPTRKTREQKTRVFLQKVEHRSPYTEPKLEF